MGEHITSEVLMSARERELADLRAKLHAAEGENERLRVLIEPKEWKGWDQIDSIYEEARLLRRERDEVRAKLERLVKAAKMVERDLAFYRNVELTNAYAVLVDALKALSHGKGEKR